ncbi:MAG: hypothetical protein DIU78_004790 [Pseudomonadota bacterium]|nr:MAG: hypothetical protein DIU78_03180 [Pseudomonadota bacterium]
MSKPFRSFRSALWLGGVAGLVLGFLVAAIVLPTTAPDPGEGAPDVRLPTMQNVPPEHAPKMKIELRDEGADTDADTP